MMSLVMSPVAAAGLRCAAAGVDAASLSRDSNGFAWVTRHRTSIFLVVQYEVEYSIDIEFNSDL
jgi:hypothetical protein